MLRNRLFAEYLGAATIVATVVGSGIMATNLSADVGIQLLINTVATVFTLYIAITLLGPISGAHFNPLVSVVELFRRNLSFADTAYFIIAQILGASSGAVIANLMILHITFAKVHTFGLGKLLPPPDFSSSFFWPSSKESIRRFHVWSPPGSVLLISLPHQHPLPTQQ
jgi:glycerol uptake facilitator-like aquaporin